jgi:hypothetical protein
MHSLLLFLIMNYFPIVFIFIYLVALPGVAGDHQKADDSIWCPTASGGCVHFVSDVWPRLSVAVGMASVLTLPTCVSVCVAQQRARFAGRA